MNTSIPVLEQALGEDWVALAPVIRTHYGLRPFSNDVLRLEGEMREVTHSRLARRFLPFARVVGAHIPYRGTGIPVNVVQRSYKDEPEFYWERIFHFPGKSPYRFQSKMLCAGEHQIVEYVRFGFGLRLRVMVENNGLIERDEGYIWKLRRLSIPLPLHVTLGRTYVEEIQLSENEFEMSMTVTHPIFGETFSYNGQFRILR